MIHGRQSLTLGYFRNWGLTSYADLGRERRPHSEPTGTYAAKGCEDKMAVTSALLKSVLV